MKTVLVYKAPDVLSYQRIVSQLYQEGILCYGPDTSVTVIYPNTPNLYLAGASAIQSGYPIFVSEDLADKAKDVIQTIDSQSSLGENSGSGFVLPSEDELEKDLAEIYARRFFVTSLLGVMLPIIPALLGVYYFKEAKRYGYHFSGVRFWGSLILYFSNLVVVIELISLLFDYKIV